MNKSSLGRKHILPPCWMFYNVMITHDHVNMGPGDMNAQETLQTSLSIVLDPYLLQMFSEMFSEMQVIILCTDQIAFQGEVYVEEVAARTSVTAASKGRSCVNSILNAFNHPLLAALTLVLELRILRKPANSFYYFNLVPFQALAHSQSSAYILFARNYPIFLDAPLSIDIRGSHRFVPGNYVDWFLIPSASRYAFHIIPTEHGNRNASCFNKLPRNLLFQVAHNVWDPTEAHGAKNILSMALVCKAWKCVVSVYFQNIGTRDGKVIDNIEGLVQSLRRQPEMAPHITSVSFHQIVPYGGYEGFEGACTDLISVSPFLTDLVISYAIYQRSKTILSEKQNIRVLRISDSYGPWMEKDSESIFTLSELYTTIRNWARLVTLELTNINAPAAFQESPLEAELRPFSASFCLEELYIYSSPGLGDWKAPRTKPEHQVAQLRYFLTATPTLRLLELSRLKDISNHQMHELLLSLSPTLEILAIKECTFERADENEELAIDAAIPHLQKIRFLEVDDHSATFLTVSRKPSCDDHCQLYLALCFSLDEEEILQALEVTGWSEIRLEAPYGMAGFTPDDEVYLRIACIEIAERRGITFSLQVFSG